MKPYAITLVEAMKQLEKDKSQVFTVMMKHGDMSVEYFSPKQVDRQTPHAQDEIYVIARGHGKFNRNGEVLPCKSGDLLYVPAGMAHHFFDFSDDFATWVIFYGESKS